MAEPAGRILLARRFAAVAQTLLQQPTVERTLQKIAEQATASVESASAAGITVVTAGGLIETAAYTDASVLEVDRIQAELREGPCLQSTVTGSVLLIDDTLGDGNWPRFSVRVADLGVRSVMACTLGTASNRRASLNLLSPRPGAFGEEAVAIATLYAEHASAALEQARILDSLRSAMHGRQAIGEATGILMERHRVDSQEAFDMLTHASQRLNVKLRLIAERVTLTGQDPGRLQAEDFANRRDAPQARS